jgi:hypothetical protein
VRVGAEEPDQARIDLELARADVLPDQHRQRLRLELLAVRTLEIDPLGHRHGSGRLPEHRAVLRNAASNCCASPALGSVVAFALEEESEPPNRHAHHDPDRDQGHGD